MRDYIAELRWLPEPAELPKPDAVQNINVLRQICDARHDWTRMAKLAKVCLALDTDDAAIAPLEPVKIWLAGNVTLDYLNPALVATGPRHGLMPRVRMAPFDQIVQPFLLNEPELVAHAPDAIVLFLDALPLVAGADPVESTDRIVDGVLAQISRVAEIAAKNFGATVFVTTTPPPAESLFGSIERTVPGTAAATIERINGALITDDMASAPVPIDLAAWASVIGVAEWRAPRMWHKAKLSFAPELTPLVADLIMRAVAARRGKSRRCLVLDLDNTIWGGVVGDDGPDNVLIGAGNPVGEAHLAIQRLAKQLRSRGIVLAVSSKNDHANAIAPFESRPEMELALDDIAVFQANWHDKASNLRAIAETLSLGTGSLVLLDDSPAERAQVRMELPDVAVPELPEDPADFPLALTAPGYFEANRFTKEDRQRADYYAANARRVTLRDSFADLDGYLKSLEMTLEVRPFDPAWLSRVTELFAKTNQFNLTLRRFTDAEIHAFAKHTDTWTAQASLRDRFGENGLISAVVVHKNDTIWRVANWVMSCRVLGRRVEEGILSRLVADAMSAGVASIEGLYRAGPRNDLVREHYAKLGFVETQSNDDGSVIWRLDTADFRSPTLPFTVDASRHSRPS